MVSGAIVGGILGLAGNVAAGVAQSREYKRLVEESNERRKKLNDWYNRKYNEDILNTATAQRLLTQAEEAMKNRNRAAQGAAAVMGGSPDAVIAAQQANAAAMADTASSIAAAAEERKEKIENSYLNKKEAADEEINKLKSQRTANITNAARGLTQAAQSLFATGDLFKQDDKQGVQGRQAV